MVEDCCHPLSKTLFSRRTRSIDALGDAAESIPPLSIPVPMLAEIGANLREREEFGRLLNYNEYGRIIFILCTIIMDAINLSYFGRLLTWIFYTYARSKTSSEFLWFQKPVVVSFVLKIFSRSSNVMYPLFCVSIS